MSVSDTRQTPVQHVSDAVSSVPKKKKKIDRHGSDTARHGYRETWLEEPKRYIPKKKVELWASFKTIAM
jgi:hypothetical protein